MSFIKSAVAAACLAVSSFAAAAPITYYLTLTDNDGPPITDGTGSFTIEGPIDPVYQNFGLFGTGAVTAFSITVEGHTFDMTDGVSAPYVLITFISGALAGISYSGYEGVTFTASLNTAGLTYTYGFVQGQPPISLTSSGLITASLTPPTPPTTDVPLPGTLALLGIGLLGTAWLGRKGILNQTSTHPR